MRHLLFHPTHRKLIRLLRGRINDGHPIIITQADWDDFLCISQGTVPMIQRHHSIYRIILTAVNRPIEEIDKNEKVGFLGEHQIDIIEKCFSKAERNHLGAAIIVPFIERIIRKRKKRKRAKACSRG